MDCMCVDHLSGAQQAPRLESHEVGGARRVCLEGKFVHLESIANDGLYTSWSKERFQRMIVRVCVQSTECSCC